ncbi:MAG: ribonuclease P protein component [Muribaculaceae bacterium]|nr:ribonuclease P protein component [Muribaculaceae bacterium]MDE6118478.1 ribonuclease P protein component [Muribaculaceae bacterium]MDE6315485.1 ribonuclease P protein component [Muribaculaceae bacterium]
MSRLGLHKAEKLCSATSIDALFASRGKGALAFPLRMVWRSNPRRESGAAVQFLISVPKKRLRHAVDRVKMRRRIREAYRLNRQLTGPLADGLCIDVAFIYVASELRPYRCVEAAMRRLLPKLCDTSSLSPSDSIS